MDWQKLINNNVSLSVSTDTRTLKPHDIFFALKGEHFDANVLVTEALRKGASLVVMDDANLYTPNNEKVVLVDDSLVALQELAHLWRRSLNNTRILAITGTNGKTTTKELITVVLRTRYRVYSTQGNLNNSIGVPLTLLSIPKFANFGIIEMGASHLHDIKELVDIVEPDCGLITNIGMAHLEGFGSFEGVKKTKKELYDYLSEHNGFVFRNGDDPLLTELAGGIKSVVYHTGTMPEGTHLVGGYNAANISAALCVGGKYGVSQAIGLQAIRTYVPTNNRSMLVQTGKNVVVLDAYNANPSSMEVALADFDGDTYILGDMLELGTYSAMAHQNIVNSLVERKAQNVFLVGKEYEQTNTIFPTFDDVKQLGDYLEEHPLEGHKILVKGSRKNQLETLMNKL